MMRAHSSALLSEPHQMFMRVRLTFSWASEAASPVESEPLAVLSPEFAVELVSALWLSELPQAARDRHMTTASRSAMIFLISNPSFSS